MMSQFCKLFPSLYHENIAISAGRHAGRIRFYARKLLEVEGNANPTPRELGEMIFFSTIEDLLVRHETIMKQKSMKDKTYQANTLFIFIGSAMDSMFNGLELSKKEHDELSFKLRSELITVVKELSIK